MTRMLTLFLCTGGDMKLTDENMRNRYDADAPDPSSNEDDWSDVTDASRDAPINESQEPWNTPEHRPVVPEWPRKDGKEPGTGPEEPAENDLDRPWVDGANDEDGFVDAAGEIAAEEANEQLAAANSVFEPSLDAAIPAADGAIDASIGAAEGAAEGATALAEGTMEAGAAAAAEGITAAVTAAEVGVEGAALSTLSAAAIMPLAAPFLVAGVAIFAIVSELVNFFMSLQGKRPSPFVNE